MLAASSIAQVAVGGERVLPERRVVDVPHAMPLRCRAHDRRDGRVVRATDAREEVVLDLVVQAAAQPAGDHPAIRAAGLDLR